MARPGSMSFRRVRATISDALRLVLDASPRAWRFTVVLAAAAALLPPVIVWLGKHLIDLVVEGAGQGAGTRTVLPTVIGLGVVAAGFRALSAIQVNRQTMLASEVEFHAERRLLQRIARADLAYFDEPEWHDLAARASRDLNWRPYSVAYASVTLVGSIVSLVGMLVLLVALSPVLALLPLVSVVPAWFMQRRVQGYLYEFWKERTSEERMRHYYRDLLTRPEPAKEIRALILGQHFVDRHERLMNERLDTMRGLYRDADWAVAGTAMLGGVALAGAYLLVADRGLSGEFTAGDLTLVIGGYAAVTSQLAVLVGAVMQLTQNATFLSDFFSFLALERRLSQDEDLRPLPASLDDGLRFENVSFTYPTGERPAVFHLSFHVGPGEIMAIVGPNGAGKSTLVKLLLRFHDPDEGVVRVGGVDLREVDPNELRSRVGVLFQDFARYELTARENVSLGRVESRATDGVLRRALDAVQATEVVDRLRDGLDSHVGRLFDGGHDLSGGEWQRLGLARVFFRDADVWVLDEPTAALDPEAEQHLFRALRESLGNRVGIVISHRFSTARMADRIAVLEDGHVSEMGTHNELMAHRGTYARLFNLQSMEAET